ncbi:hypothetical protein NUW58_g3434 [Xylaria curta]|uniref:Uncharacterized protein n=1 Tax=Xylaria curta TaxID=42375 RepID=A0ACC1PDQ2_9PEZI|nr:hypothetical protein NUW58_g3434 [Xylaria curta]
MSKNSGGLSSVAAGTRTLCSSWPRQRTACKTCPGFIIVALPYLAPAEADVRKQTGVVGMDLIWMLTIWKKSDREVVNQSRWGKEWNAGVPEARRATNEPNRSGLGHASAPYLGTSRAGDPDGGKRTVPRACTVRDLPTAAARPLLVRACPSLPKPALLLCLAPILGPAPYLLAQGRDRASADEG